jgi:hypothetical protein
VEPAATMSSNKSSSYGSFGGGGLMGDRLSVTARRCGKATGRRLNRGR